MLRATQEHIIHVDLFKIIHPFNQRLYYLRFIVKSNGEQAIPYIYYETNHNKKESQQNPFKLMNNTFKLKNL
ncbi:unnamed protein product [Paramecium pentaurelia]|uniref:Uncharacterized protein n=1 Tax=Paramecium pentaurelia TaxID=43138 RepID=A0A8S1VD70_9CILI|nr:unnamed protein product [Paramecium pentaurelia]CAD8173899.1 unnamed protein product [Paramecium pentaurelia]